MNISSWKLIRGVGATQDFTEIFPSWRSRKRTWSEQERERERERERRRRSENESSRRFLSEKRKWKREVERKFIRYTCYQLHFRLAASFLTFSSRSLVIAQTFSFFLCLPVIPLFFLRYPFHSLIVLTSFSVFVATQFCRDRFPRLYFLPTFLACSTSTLRLRDTPCRASAYLYPCWGFSYSPQWEIIFRLFLFLRTIVKTFYGIRKFLRLKSSFSELHFFF